jgi:hypothetical protein
MFANLAQPHVPVSTNVPLPSMMHSYRAERGNLVR